MARTRRSACRTTTCSKMALAVVARARGAAAGARRHTLDMPKTINSPLSNLAAAADASSSSYSHSAIPLQVATPAEPKGDYIAERGYTRLRYISQQRRGIVAISHLPISLNKAHRATAFVSAPRLLRVRA